MKITKQTPTKRTSTNKKIIDVEDFPLGERAYRYIKQAIQIQKLLPGDRLREVDLAEMIGLSRTPIREALGRLEAEGLVVHDPIRGIMVAELDYSMTTELYSMREVLEGAAARLAAQHASEVEISILEDLCRQYESAVGNEVTLSLRNRQFHDTLYRCSHNRYLIKILVMLHDNLMLLGNTTLTDPKRVKATLEEHEAVVTAIRERNPEKAEQALRNHIHASQKIRLKRMFES